MKKDLLILILIYIPIRMIAFYINSNGMKNDIGENGAFILFTIFTIVEIVITSIPLLFKKILNIIFYRKIRIYLYFLSMLFIHIFSYNFLAENINLVDIWIFEVVIILLISLFFNKISKSYFSRFSSPEVEEQEELQ